MRVLKMWGVSAQGGKREKVGLREKGFWGECGSKDRKLLAGSPLLRKKIRANMAHTAEPEDVQRRESIRASAHNQAERQISRCLVFDPKALVQKMLNRSEGEKRQTGL